MHACIELVDIVSHYFAKFPKTRANDADCSLMRKHELGSLSIHDIWQHL